MESVAIVVITPQRILIMRGKQASDPDTSRPKSQNRCSRRINRAIIHLRTHKEDNSVRWIDASSDV